MKPNYSASSVSTVLWTHRLIAETRAHLFESRVVRRSIATFTGPFLRTVSVTVLCGGFIIMMLQTTSRYFANDEMMHNNGRKLSIIHLTDDVMPPEFNAFHTNYQQLFMRQGQRLHYENLLNYNDKQIEPSGSIQVDTAYRQVSNSTDLKIAWLMSFPNSGTSYTGRMIRTITQTHTASNYGCEDKAECVGNSLRVYEDQASGPFYVEVDPVEHPERKFPQKYVLTKTHCGIRCETCPPKKYVETTYSFRHRCLSGSWSEQSTDGISHTMYGTYPPTRVAKAIHLIRDPFDNIVSRFHLEQHESGRDRRRIRYTTDREGFREFCRDLNAKYVAEEIQYDFLNGALHDLTADIPCRTDFLRYTEWHNLAFSTTRDMDIDTYVLHYDDYETRFSETVSELLTFLELEAAAEPEPFELGKAYKEYFTEDERFRIRVAVEWMSSPLTWHHLKRYFNDV